MGTVPKHGGSGNRNADTLRRVLETRIANEPHQFDGETWAAAPQNWWCDQAGVSSATLRRLIGQPPFVRKGCQINGRKVTLLRVGTPGSKSALDYARIMSKIWREKIGRRTSPAEFGCLVGLAETWPEGKAPKLLTVVLGDWPMFMAGVKIEAEHPKFFKYPSLRVIRRFPHVAVEMLLMQEQGKAAKVPA